MLYDTNRGRLSRLGIFAGVYLTLELQPDVLKAETDLTRDA